MHRAAANEERDRADNGPTSPPQSDRDLRGGGRWEEESVGSDEEELVMVIRLAAVEGDQFSGNAESGGVLGVYENGNQGPTDLSTANIQ